jgi:putative flippase GtrA
MSNAVDGRQVARFIAAGAVAVGTDCGLYAILRAGLPPGAAKALSFVCGGVVAFFLNNYWVFPRGGAPAAGAVRFAVANTLLLGVNVLTNGAVLAAWPSAVLPALAVATAVTSFLSYVSFKWWVFRNP